VIAHHHASPTPPVFPRELKKGQLHAMSCAQKEMPPKYLEIRRGKKKEENGMRKY